MTLGLPEKPVPRKNDPEYARVIVYLIQQAQKMKTPGTSINRLIYLGDALQNDVSAFSNICRSINWSGIAFIGSEQNVTSKMEIQKDGKTQICFANRWSLLADFDRYFCNQDPVSNRQTAVIIDLDKTALGAKGRNDHAIDQARIEAVARTVNDLLGDNFDPEDFRTAYDLLNQPEFHPFTGDNQDYLAYICLMLNVGITELEPLVKKVRSGEMKNFNNFLAEVEANSSRLSSDLSQFHKNIYSLVKKGDPTPFKAYRFNEYLSTIERMGKLDDSASPEEMLEKEIVITQEVREFALKWRKKGALLMGLSDKPEEASFPSDELAEQGYLPIHLMKTHSVGV